MRKAAVFHTMFKTQFIEEIVKRMGFPSAVVSDSHCSAGVGADVGGGGVGNSCMVGGGEVGDGGRVGLGGGEVDGAVGAAAARAVSGKKGAGRQGTTGVARR